MRWFVILFCVILSASLPAQTPVSLAQRHIDASNYSEAEKILLEAVSNNDEAELSSLLGEVYGYQEEWDKAIDIYRNLTLNYPRKAEYMFRYGGVLAKKAQNSNPFVGLALLGKIKSSFMTVLKLEPGHIGAHWALIDLYISLPGIAGGSISKANDYATRLISWSKVDGYLALGYVHEYDDQPQKARDYYIKALNLLDEMEVIERNQLNYQIGKICSDFEIEMDKGIFHLKEYADHYTVLDGVPLEWAYYRLAKIYRKKSDKDEALIWISKSLELSPDLQPAIAEKSAIERL